MSEEQVEEWLKNEYGMTYKELQQCHDFRCDEVLKQDKEIERLNTEKEQLNSLVNFNQKEIRRLHNIIKEAREYIKETYIKKGAEAYRIHILLILEKAYKEGK